MSVPANSARSSTSASPPSSTLTSRRPAAQPRVRCENAATAKSDSCGRRPASRVALLGGEGELGEPDLGHRALEPVLRQGHVRVHPGDQQEAQPPGGVPQQEVEVVEHLLPGQRLGVVEDQHDRRRPFAEHGCEPDQQGVLHHVDPVRRAHLARVQARSPQPGQHVRPEDARELVLLLEADPHHRPGGVAGLHPGTDQDGLARPRGRAHERERPPDAGREVLEQPRTRHDGRLDGGREELRRHDRITGGRGCPLRRVGHCSHSRRPPAWGGGPTTAHPLLSRSHPGGWG